MSYYPIKIDYPHAPKVTYNGVDAKEIIHDAIDLAHAVLEELSIYRQQHDLDSMEFSFEADCCEFLDKVGD